MSAVPVDVVSGPGAEGEGRETLPDKTRGFVGAVETRAASVVDSITEGVVSVGVTVGVEAGWGVIAAMVKGFSIVSDDPVFVSAGNETGVVGCGWCMRGTDVVGSTEPELPPACTLSG